MMCVLCGWGGLSWPHPQARNPERQRIWLASLGYDGQPLCIGCVCTLNTEHPWVGSKT